MPVCCISIMQFLIHPWMKPGLHLWKLHIIILIWQNTHSLPYFWKQVFVIPCSYIRICIFSHTHCLITQFKNSCNGNYTLMYILWQIASNWLHLHCFLQWKIQECGMYHVECVKGKNYKTSHLCKNLFLKVILHKVILKNWLIVKWTPAASTMDSLTTS